MMGAVWVCVQSVAFHCSDTSITYWARTRPQDVSRRTMERSSLTHRGCQKLSLHTCKLVIWKTETLLFSTDPELLDLGNTVKQVMSTERLSSEMRKSTFPRSVSAPTSGCSQPLPAGGGGIQRPLLAPLNTALIRTHTDTQVTTQFKIFFF